MNDKRQIGILLTFLLLFCINFVSLAQDSGKKYKPRQFRKEPIWIEMMNDPNANYYLPSELSGNFGRAGYYLKNPLKIMSLTHSKEKWV